MTVNHNSYQWPAWFKVSTYFLIIFAAAVLASRISVLDSIFFYFGIALLLSYFFLRSDGRKLSDLGLVPKTRKNWRQLAVGATLGVLALCLCAAINIMLSGALLKFNTKVDPVFLFVLILMHLWSAFAQEFTYRGYPFQSLLKAYGPWVAQLGVILPFAVMHIKLDQPITTEQFLMIILGTGIGSILYGLCYIRTGNLLLAVGLHFGWNIAQALVPRSGVQPKTMLLTLIPGKAPEQMLHFLLPYIFVSCLLYWWISRLPVKKA